MLVAGKNGPRGETDRSAPSQAIIIRVIVADMWCGQPLHRLYLVQHHYPDTDWRNGLLRLHGAVVMSDHCAREKHSFVV